MTEAGVPDDEPWPWHPDIQPNYPHVPDPLVAKRRNNRIAPSPGGEGVGGGASLVQYKGITSTEHRQPSEIAKDALSKINKEDPYFQLCTDYVEYLEQCELKEFVIRGYDTEKGKFKAVRLDYNNRWGHARRKDLSKKLEKLETWFEMQEDRPVTLVTLTSYQEGMSIAGAWHELNKSRVKLQKLIAKYFDSPDYFWVVEPHQSGYVHYHMAVFAHVDNYTRDKSKHIGWVRCKGRESEDIWELMDGLGIEDKFRILWEEKYKTGNHTYGLDFSKKEDENKINHLKNYLSKYLEKGFLLNKWTPGMLKFNANLWETGFRMYGASKNIREIMNIKNEKPSQTVWLETKIKEPETITEDIIDNSSFPPKKQTVMTIIEYERTIWYRQYIPDWLDSDFWVWQGKVRQEDPPKIYIYEWGRKASESKSLMSVPVIMVRRKEEDPYEQYNKEYAQRNNRKL